ncbi:MAG: phosphoribosylpyrophosphate synthetase [Nitrososphaerota archaeon]
MLGARLIEQGRVALRADPTAHAGAERAHRFICFYQHLVFKAPAGCCKALPWAVASGPASYDLAKKICSGLDAEWVDVQWRTFPDGENLLRLTSSVLGKKVLLVQSTYPPVDTHYMQLFLLASKLSEAGAEVFCIMPYMGYARQDREFMEGEVVSIGVLGRLLKYTGVKRLVTVDIHSPRALAQIPLEAYSLSAIPLLAEYAKTQLKLRNPLAVAPDQGAATRVQAFSALYGCEWHVLTKRRDRVTGEVEVTAAGLEKVAVEGRDILLIDDILSTGSSLLKAGSLFYSLGAAGVRALCVHPLLVGGALEKLKAARIDVIGTNTVPSPVSYVDVSPLIISYFSHGA